MDSSRKWREKYAPYTDDASILKLSPEELETSKQLNALRKSIVKARTRREKTKKDQKKVKAFARSRDKIPTATLSGLTKIATQYEIRPSVRIKKPIRRRDRRTGEYKTPQEYTTTYKQTESYQPDGVSKKLYARKGSIRDRAGRNPRIESQIKMGVRGGRTLSQQTFGREGASNKELRDYYDKDFKGFTFSGGKVYKEGWGETPPGSYYMMTFKERGNAPEGRKGRGRKMRVPIRNRHSARNFSQRVVERTQTGAKVVGSESKGYTQRTGNVSRTEFSKVKPATFDSVFVPTRRDGNAVRSSMRSGRQLDGNRLRSDSRSDVLKSQRYISATQQSLIERKIRNTEAENRLATAIKDVRDTEKKKLDALSVITKDKEKALEKLSKEKAKLLQQHEVIVAGNLNASLLGNDDEQLNKIIARGNYMGFLKRLIRDGELTKNGVIGMLDVSVDERRTLLKQLNETSEYQEGRDYFYKEFDNMGNPRIYMGTYREGGERGGNIILLREDGVEVSIRKRQIMKPEEVHSQQQLINTPQPTSPILRPSVSFSQGGDSQQVNNWLSGQSTSSSSIRSGSSLGEGGEGQSPFPEEDPYARPESPLEASPFSLGDPTTASYNKMVGELIPQNERQLRSWELELEELRIPSVGAFGWGRTANEAAIKRREKLEEEIMKLNGIISEQKTSANKIAVERDFVIPYKDDAFIPAKTLIQKELANRPSEEGASGGILLTNPVPFDSPSEELLQPEPQLASPYQSEEEELFSEEEGGVAEQGGGQLEGSNLPLLSISDALVEPSDTISLEEAEQLDALKDIENAKLQKSYTQLRVYKDEDGDGLNMGEDPDPRYKAFKFMDYPLVVDTQTNKVIDPEGGFPMYDINPMGTPGRVNFIKFPSESAKIEAVAFIKEIEAQKKADAKAKEDEKEKAQRIATSGGGTPFMEAIFDRDKDGAIKTAIANRPSEDSLMIWSTKHPDERQTPKRGVFMTRDQFETYARDTANYKPKELSNLLATYDKAKAGGKKEFATNNKKFLEPLGLVSAIASQMDYRSSQLQLE